MATYDKPMTVIEPRSGWRLIDLKELREYRDLFFFLIWRNVKVRYAQSVLGVGWAIIQPLFSMLVFTVVFGNLARLDSDGVPYALFSFAALVPWTFFSNSVTEGSGALIQNSNLISKIYFPRIILPTALVLGKFIDFFIALLVMALLLVLYGMLPGPQLVFLPVAVVLMFVASVGVSYWISALAIQYRDVKYGINFGIQLLMYLAPVVYPISYIPEQYRLIYAVNPLVGVIETFRSCILSTNPVPWDLLLVGGLSGLLIAVGGAFYFRRMERVFADVA